MPEAKKPKTKEQKEAEKKKKAEEARLAEGGSLTARCMRLPRMLRCRWPGSHARHCRAPLTSKARPRRLHTAPRRGAPPGRGGRAAARGGGGAQAAAAGGAALGGTSAAYQERAVRCRLLRGLGFEFYACSAHAAACTPLHGTAAAPIAPRMQQPPHHGGTPPRNTATATAPAAQRRASRPTAAPRPRAARRRVSGSATPRARTCQTRGSRGTCGTT